MSRSLVIPKFPNKGDLSDASDINDLSDSIYDAFLNLQRGYKEIEYVSGAQAIVSGSDYSLAHGLSTKPYLVEIQLVCTAGEHGYSIGDRVYASASKMIKNQRQSTGVGNDMMVWTEAGATSETHIRVRIGAGTYAFAAPNKSTNAIAQLTNANWSMYIYAYSSEVVPKTEYYTKPTVVTNITSTTDDLNDVINASDAAFTAVESAVVGATFIKGDVTESFTSTLYNVPSPMTATVIPHGLSTAPKFAAVIVRCANPGDTFSDRDISIGDEFLISHQPGSNHIQNSVLPYDMGIQVIADATNITILSPSNSQSYGPIAIAGFNVPTSATPVFVKYAIWYNSTDLENFKVYVKAWA